MRFLRHDDELAHRKVFVKHLSLASRIGRTALVLAGTAALAVQGAGVWGATWVAENQVLLKDQLVAYQFEPSPALSDYVAYSGLSDTGELYLMTSLPQIVPSYEFDRYCSRSEPGIGVLGCYTLRDQRIYLYDVTDARLVSIEPVVAAHEMLHAAWARLSLAQREQIAVLLEQGFASLGSDHPLVERIATYESEDPTSRIPELYAILGTEVGQLPQELEEHYATYFSDRTKVVSLSAEVYAVFDSLSGELLNLSNDLESRNAEIEGLRYTYEETSQALRVDVLAFNDKASTPGAFPSKSEFEATRAALVERQNRLEGMRVALQTKIGEYNELLDELNTLNDEVSELNQGINITLEAKDELVAEDHSLEE